MANDTAEFHDSQDGTGLSSSQAGFSGPPSDKELEKSPIERLRPGSDLHQKVLDYLKERLNFSEREMGKFYARWNYNEKRLQGFIDLSEFEQKLKDDNDAGKPAAVTSIVVPYAYATVSTIVTYCMHAYGGRNPMFQVGTYGNADPTQSLLMENWLQYNADHTRLLRHLYTYFNDTQVYGIGIMRNDWEVQTKERTVYRQENRSGFLGIDLGSERTKTREMRTVYSGNECVSVDPFMFFPDPRVPMTEVASKGEWVMWRQFLGLHDLKVREAQGQLRYIDSIPKKLPKSSETGAQDAPSDRGIRSRGEGNPGSSSRDGERGVSQYVQVDQGTFEIIPAELGLGISKIPEKWVFTVGNKHTILQAEPFERDHDMHPVSVSEPYGNGYGFGQLGVVDMVGPLQDTMSWFVNSHIYNVRAVLNNSMIVDPSMIEMQDLNNSEPGKHIRLKRSAFGQDVRTAIQQLEVHDVTRNNVNDLQMFSAMADQIAAVNDNLRGIQASGGRKTATEVRTAGEAGASRLASLVRLISAQGMTDLTQQQVINTQQFLDRELFMNVTGADGRQNSILMSPEHIAGDFYFPVHDGTLPTDRVAMLDIWREIFTGLISVPELAQRYDIGGIFEFMAEMGGAGNIERFKVGMAPDNQLQAAEQAGNVVPLRDAGNIPGLEGVGSNKTGLEANPRRRLE